MAVIRISGPESLAILSKRFISRSGKLISEIESQKVILGDVVDRDGKIQDEVLVTFFKGPHSYTGEDVIEVSCHGGSRVTKALVQLFIKEGARPT